METVTEQIERRYRQLLIYLDGQVVEIDHIRLMAELYLNPKELLSNKFLDICSELKKKGKLGPHNLSLMKEFFPEEKDTDAYSAIVKAEKDIEGHEMAVRITTKEINPHTSSADKIFTAIKNSFEKNMEIIYESNLGHEERTNAVKKSASAHKKAFKLFKEMHEYIGRNGFSMNHMDTGSLRLFFRFYSRQGIERFQEMYHSGELLAILQSGLVTDELLEECSVQAVILDAEISDEDIKLCLDKMGTSLFKGLQYITEYGIYSNNTAPNTTCRDTEYKQSEVLYPSHDDSRHDNNILVSLRQQIVSTENRIFENERRTAAEKDKIDKHCIVMKNELESIARKYADECKTIGDVNKKNLENHLECLKTLYAQYESVLTQWKGSPSSYLLSLIDQTEILPSSPKSPTITIFEFNLNVICSDKLQKLFGDITSYSDSPEKIDVLVPLDYNIDEHVTLFPQLLQNVQQLKCWLHSNSDSSGPFLHLLLDNICRWFYIPEIVQLANRSFNMPNLYLQRP